MWPLKEGHECRYVRAVRKGNDVARRKEGKRRYTALLGGMLRCEAWKEGYVKGRGDVAPELGRATPGGGCPGVDGVDGVELVIASFP